MKQSQLLLLAVVALAGYAIFGYMVPYVQDSKEKKVAESAQELLESYDLNRDATADKAAYEFANKYLDSVGLQGLSASADSSSVELTNPSCRVWNKIAIAVANYYGPNSQEATKAKFQASGHC